MKSNAETTTGRQIVVAPTGVYGDGNLLTLGSCTPSAKTCQGLSTQTRHNPCPSPETLTGSG
eukprot:scaffold154_cov373-Prasinococcus_capsulatus_cf.AAC.9